MIDKLKVFEVAWKEFAGWIKQRLGSDGFNDMEDAIERLRDDEPSISERFVIEAVMVKLLIEFLDSKGIYVEIGISYDATKRLDRFFWLVDRIEKVDYSDIDYLTRQQATEAGIIKAFEILNQKEK